MPTRKLAGGHLPVAPSPRQMRTEKLFFRQQTDKLGQLLESEARYCPSYKRNSSTHNRILSGATSSSDRVSLETPFRSNHSRPQIDDSYETLYRYGDFRCYMSPVFSKNSPPSKSDKKCRSKAWTKYRSQLMERGSTWQPQETSKIDNCIDSMDSKVFTENGLPIFVRVKSKDAGMQDENRNIEGNNPHTECQRIRFTNEGQVASYTDSNNERDFDIIGKSTSYRGPVSRNTDAEIDSGLHQAHMHAFRTYRSRRGRLLFSRQHGPSLNCDIFGPLVCKYCTRHLSIANATLTLPIQSFATYSSTDLSCPLCRAEKMSLMGHKARSASSERQYSSSSPAYPFYYHYTPLELFLRVRDRKRAEIFDTAEYGSTSDETGEESDPNQSPNSTYQECVEKEKMAEGNRKLQGGSIPDRVEFGSDSAIKDGRCCGDQGSTAHEHAGMHFKTSNSFWRVDEDCFDGIRITVKYLNNANAEGIEPKTSASVSANLL